jgi:lipoprotein-anchoring transpeptidase ErfK/SrfK
MTGGSKATGDYYSLPDVRWDTYFDGGNAFHTAYWHNNFGTPMSHGCINMREADAKVVYDFAPLGTKVVVHY